LRAAGAHTSAYASSAYVSSAYVSIHQLSIRQHTSAYVRICQLSIRQHTSAYVVHLAHPSSLRAAGAPAAPAHHTSAYVSIRQHTSAYVDRGRSSSSTCTPYVSIRQHTLRVRSSSKKKKPAQPGGEVETLCCHGSRLSAYVIRQHTSYVA
jgi:hypothetical protein